MEKNMETTRSIGIPGNYIEFKDLGLNPKP